MPDLSFSPFIGFFFILAINVLISMISSLLFSWIFFFNCLEILGMLILKTDSYPANALSLDISGVWYAFSF